jgi:hypothetical protein
VSRRRRRTPACGPSRVGPRPRSDAVSPLPRFGGEG